MILKREVSLMFVWPEPQQPKLYLGASLGVGGNVDADADADARSESSASALDNHHSASQFQHHPIPTLTSPLQ